MDNVDNLGLKYVVSSSRAADLIDNAMYACTRNKTKKNSKHEVVIIGNKLYICIAYKFLKLQSNRNLNFRNKIQTIYVKISVIFDHFVNQLNECFHI